MNTSPNAKVVLCFGDSSTRGTRPDDGRYEANIRWTGQLQNKLGEDFYVIEEGLGGRTTNLDHPLEEKPGRNGLIYFKPCLFSHSPLDVLVLMLGTNDLKNVYNRSAKDVAEVLAEYCDFTHEHDRNIKIVLVAPVPFIATEPIEFYDNNSSEKSKELPEEIKHVAEAKGVTFVNASDYVSLGSDGLHWNEVSHGRFADELERVVKNL